jgi:hypothetical protein
MILKRRKTTVSKKRALVEAKQKSYNAGPELFGAAFIGTAIHRRHIILT